MEINITIQRDMRYWKWASTRSSLQWQNKKAHKIIKEKLRRNPKRSLRKLAEYFNDSKGIMFTIYHGDLNTSKYKNQWKQLLSQNTRMKYLARKKLLSHIHNDTLPNIVFRNKKKLDVQQKFNPQNDQIWSKSGNIESRVIIRWQTAASVMFFIYFYWISSQN